MPLSDTLTPINEDGVCTRDWIRLSSGANSTKWEPSFKVELKSGTYKVRRILKKQDWETKRAITQGINGLVACILPQIFWVGENYVIKEFVPGEDLSLSDKIDRAKLAELFYTFHTASQKAINSSRLQMGFKEEEISRSSAINISYIGDNRLFSKGQINCIENIIRDIPGNYHLGAVHGDLALHNIIVTPEGTYRLIDLESLKIFPIEYDMVKPFQDIFTDDPHILKEAYGNCLDSYYSNEKYWVMLYLTQKLAERIQMNRPKGIQRALELIKRII